MLPSLDAFSSPEGGSLHQRAKRSSPTGAALLPLLGPLGAAHVGWGPLKRGAPDSRRMSDQSHFAAGCLAAWTKHQDVAPVMANLGLAAHQVHWMHFRGTGCIDGGTAGSMATPATHAVVTHHPRFVCFEWLADRILLDPRRAHRVRHSWAHCRRRHRPCWAHCHSCWVWRMCRTFCRRWHSRHRACRARWVRRHPRARRAGHRSRRTS